MSVPVPPIRLGNLKDLQGWHRRMLLDRCLRIIRKQVEDQAALGYSHLRFDPYHVYQKAYTKVDDHVRELCRKDSISKKDIILELEEKFTELFQYMDLDTYETQLDHVAEAGETYIKWSFKDEEEE